MSSQGGFGVPPYFQNNSVSSSYGLNGELPPEIAIKEQALNRKQQIANLLLQNGMKPLEGGHMAGRFYVPPSWSQGLEKVTQAALGAYGNYKVDQDRAALGEENKNYTADAIKQWQTDRNGTPEQPGQPMEMPAQGPGAPEMASMLAMRSGSGDPGVSGKLPDLSAPIAIEGPQPTNTVTGPPTPAIPATPEQKQAADMALLAKRVPGAQAMLQMQQHNELLKQNQDFQKEEHRLTREATAEQKEADRVNRREIAKGQLDNMVMLKMITQDQADAMMKRHDDQADLTRREIAKQADDTRREQGKRDDETRRYIADTRNEAAATGKVPPGYRQTADGNLEAVPGGPADQKIQGQFSADTSRLESMTASLNRLGQSANEVLNHPGLAGITGLRGALPNIPGTDAADAQAKLDTLKAKVSFGVLQEMRDNSKTGGALGQVSDFENKRLEAALQPLQNAQSLEQMKEAVKGIVTYAEEAKDRMRSAYNMKHGDKKTEAAPPEAPKRLKFDAQGNAVQ